MSELTEVLPPWPRRVQQGVLGLFNSWLCFLSLCADATEGLRTKAEMALTPRVNAAPGRITAADVPFGCGQRWVRGWGGGVPFLGHFSVLRSPVACSRNCKLSGARAAWGKLRLTHCLCPARRQETLMSPSQCPDHLEKLRCLSQPFQPSFGDPVLLSGTSVVLVSGGEMIWELGWFGDLREEGFLNDSIFL